MIQRTIEIKNLKFKYPGSSVWQLDIPEFFVNTGERVFMYGPSGCGKSTFLEILAGVQSAADGEVWVCKKNLSELSGSELDAFRADRLGYIFQSFNLIPYLSVLENLSLPLALSKHKRSKVPVHREFEVIQELIASLDLQAVTQKPVNQLSVGQQQRVAAARAVLGEPQLILADEPTSALDYDRREGFLKLLFSLCEKFKMSVLFVSHDRTLERFFDRSVNFNQINRAELFAANES